MLPTLSSSYLTATVHISVVTVSLSLAGEGVSVRVLEDVLVTCRQGPAALLGQDQASPQEAADCQTQYSGHSGREEHRTVRIFHNKGGRQQHLPGLLSLPAPTDHWSQGGTGNIFIRDSSPDCGHTTNTNHSSSQHIEIITYHRTTHHTTSL